MIFTWKSHVWRIFHASFLPIQSIFSMVIPWQVINEKRPFSKERGRLTLLVINLISDYFLYLFIASLCLIWFQRCTESVAPRHSSPPSVEILVSSSPGRLGHSSLLESWSVPAADDTHVSSIASQLPGSTWVGMAIKGLNKTNHRASINIFPLR